MYVPEEDIHYRAEGLASWYGDDFHGRQTANGEIFDMTALTAAHPTLPMPSYVRVTNIRNGKSVIVRINDRGPYHGNRLIDVSTRTAKLLEFDGYGVARVRVEYVGRAPLEGSDDRLLEATLRTGVPAPAPSTVMIASAKPFIPVAAAPVGRVRGDVPLPEGRPYTLGNTTSDVASLNATSEMSASRRASVDERVLFNPREVTYDAPIDDPASQPVARASRPVSAYAPILGASPDPMAGRGLY
jgi:rare lipoprotein A